MLLVAPRRLLDVVALTPLSLAESGKGSPLRQQWRSWWASFYFTVVPSSTRMWSSSSVASSFLHLRPAILVICCVVRLVELCGRFGWSLTLLTVLYTPLFFRELLCLPTMPFNT
jgi:hypothetical protein